MSSANKKLVVVTGLSGSGKSIALDALEDAGFYCIDNLPVSLFHTFADEVLAESSPLYRRAAVGIDARNQANDLNQVIPRIARLRSRGIPCEIVFLDAQQDVLIRRFSETRRRHPLTADQRSLEQAIALERQLLEPLLNAADLRVDTTRTTLHELRALIRERVAEHPQGQLSIVLESFGFKHGVPGNADYVFDLRCLPNPHWRADLRPFTGKDAPVADFLAADERVGRMFDHIADFLDAWIPCFQAENRAYLTVAVGCTGGQHRSVYFVERLGRDLRERGHETLVRHRELP
jgi:UPF0042 nucleotide-binding protein